MNTLTTINRFWGQFLTSELYDTGYSDAVEGCGANRLESYDDAVRALAYMTGYAHACRLACPFMSKQWRIANLIGCIAGIMLANIDVPSTIAERCPSWTAELRAEMAA